MNRKHIGRTGSTLKSQQHGWCNHPSKDTFQAAAEPALGAGLFGGLGRAGPGQVGPSGTTPGSHAQDSEVGGHRMELAIKPEAGGGRREPGNQPGRPRPPPNSKDVSPRMRMRFPTTKMLNVTKRVLATSLTGPSPTSPSP